MIGKFAPTAAKKYKQHCFHSFEYRKNQASGIHPGGLTVVKTFLGIRGAWFVIHDRLAQAGYAKTLVFLFSSALMVN
jgi:hypothetical protein